MASTRQVRWTLIGWLFVLSAVAYLDRVNISIAGKLMAQEYALSNRQLRLRLQRLRPGLRTVPGTERASR